MHAVESGLFVHSVSFIKLRWKMIALFRETLNIRTIKLDKTQVVNNNVIELRELLRRVL
jgi:hypothetical protein